MTDNTSNDTETAARPDSTGPDQHTYALPIVEYQELFSCHPVSGSGGKKYFFKSAEQTTGSAAINMLQLRGVPLLVPPIDARHKYDRRTATVATMKSIHRASLMKFYAHVASPRHRAFIKDSG